MPRQEAALLADAIESFYVDPAIPEDPFAGRPATDADPAEGPAPVHDARLPRLSRNSENKGGYYGPPLADSAARLKPGWVFTWLKGPQRWRANMPLPELRPDRHRRPAPDRLPGDPARGPGSGAGRGGRGAGGRNEMNPRIRVWAASLLLLGVGACSPPPPAPPGLTPRLRRRQH